MYPEAPTKNRQINRERNYISRSCEKPKCIPSKDQYNSFFDEQHKCNIFLNPYNLWDNVPAALMSLNQSDDRYSMPNQYPQSETHQPRTDSYLVFSSLRGMDSKGKDCVSAVLSFNELTFQRDERTKQLLRLKILVISGNTEHWMEFHRLR